MSSQTQPRLTHHLALSHSAVIKGAVVRTRGSVKSLVKSHGKQAWSDCLLKKTKKESHRQGKELHRQNSTQLMWKENTPVFGELFCPSVWTFTALSTCPCKPYRCWCCWQRVYSLGSIKIFMSDETGSKHFTETQAIVAQSCKFTLFINQWGEFGLKFAVQMPD